MTAEQARRSRLFPRAGGRAPEPVYAERREQPRKVARLRGPSRCGRVGVGDTDAGTGAPTTTTRTPARTTWESPLRLLRAPPARATSPASVAATAFLETEWGQYWDEESRRVFFTPRWTGETAWEDEV